MNSNANTLENMDILVLTDEERRTLRETIEEIEEKEAINTGYEEYTRQQRELNKDNV